MAKRTIRCKCCGKAKAPAQFYRQQDGSYTEDCLVCLREQGVLAERRPGNSAPRVDQAKLGDLERRRAAKRELAARELARRRLVHYIRRFNPKYKDGWVHHAICEELERFYEEVQQGLSPRLMIFMPPRHGKSEIVSDYFPSWALGKDPTLELIATSYSAALPLKYSKRNRERLRSKNYHQLFPETRLHHEVQNADAWKTSENGGFQAAGVGGSVTGFGAHIFIIDDPVKDAEEADSDVVRESTWDWWSAVASTRVAPGGGVLVIQTRWHDDDLSGRMLAQMEEQMADDDTPEDEIEKWRILSFPAIAEDDEYRLPNGDFKARADIEDEELPPGTVCVRRKGEALHEERWPLTYLRRKRRTMVPRHWNALYQQNPIPDEGEFFLKGDMRYANFIVLPTDIILAAVDMAISPKKKSAYTVLSVGALEYTGRLKILDVQRGRWGVPQIVDALIAAGRTYGSRLAAVGLEAGQIKEAVMPSLKQAMVKERVFLTIDHSLNPVEDKEVRARPLQGMIQTHNVVFPENQPWVPGVISEMLRFPAGRYKDVVDSLAWLARMALDRPLPPPPKSRRKASWKDRLRQYERGNRVKDPMAA